MLFASIWSTLRALHETRAANRVACPNFASGPERLTFVRNEAIAAMAAFGTWRGLALRPELGGSGPYLIKAPEVFPLVQTWY
jgi:hypothetical protein